MRAWGDRLNVRPGRRAAAAAVIAVLGAEALAATPVAASSDQTISFTMPPAAVTNEVLHLVATATSGLPVTFSTTTPDQCSVSGTDVVLAVAGTCTVVASQAGNASWAAAPDVQQSVLASDPPPGPQAQTISFTLPAAGYQGATVPLDAETDSPLEITYSVSTPSVCLADGTTLALDAAGTCTVVASQAGNVEWQPATPITASITVSATPFGVTGADLGHYALNAPVKSISVDPVTGDTYVAGPFTQIGARTGAVTVVDGPGSGSDEIAASSPDVVASQTLVLPDDATHYFISAHVSSINGDGKVRSGWLTRMNADGTPDTAWTMSTTCPTATPNWSQFQPSWAVGPWLAAITPLSGTTTGDSTVGLSLISRSTGVAKRTGAGDADCGTSGRIWPSIPALPPLAACSGLAYCSGSVTDVAYDASTHTLLALTLILAGPDANHVDHQSWLVAYDTQAGSRRWLTRLESAPPVGWLPAPWQATVTAMSVVGNGVLVSGRFPRDSVGTTADMTTSDMLLDVASGQILQRWNAHGEQDLATPSSTIAPATDCLPLVASASTPDRFSFTPIAAGHVAGYGRANSQTYHVCDYSTTGSGIDTRLAASSLGTLGATPSTGTVNPLPSTLVAGRYLAGMFDAFDLQSGTQVADWHPTPSDPAGDMIAVGTSVAMGGDFSFLHGAAANMFAKLGPDLTPDATFTSHVTNPSPLILDIRGMAQLGNRLIAVGNFTGSFGTAHIIAVDTTTGDVTWHATGDPAYPLSLAVDPETGSFYVGYESDVPNYVVRYIASGDGYALDATFGPAIAGIDGTTWVSGLAFIKGRLYAGGQFSAVDGQPRQGLARIGTDGTVDAWAPKLIDEMSVPADASSIELQPRSFVETANGVLVAGTWHYFVPGNGGYLTYGPPSVLVYSLDQGSRVYPAVGAASSFGALAVDAYDAVQFGNRIYVGLWSYGIAAFDASSFVYLPYLSIRTLPGWGSTMIMALAMRPGAVPLAGVRPMVSGAGSPSLFAGGDLVRWGARSASGIVGLPPGALTADHAAPTVSGVVAKPRGGSVVTSAGVPYTISWTGTDGSKGSGIARYEVESSRNGGTWTPVSVSAATASIALRLVSGSTYQFRVRAIDNVGNRSSWAASVAAKVALVQQTTSSITWSGSWKTLSGAAYSGSSTRSSTSAGASATFHVSARAFGLVGSRGLAYGKARIYVDGRLAATIDTRATTTVHAVTVWAIRWSTTGTHTITVVVLATSGRPRFDIDAFTSLR